VYTPHSAIGIWHLLSVQKQLLKPQSARLFLFSLRAPYSLSLSPKEVHLRCQVKRRKKSAVCFVSQGFERAQCSFSAAAAVIGVKTCRVRDSERALACDAELQRHAQSTFRPSPPRLQPGINQKHKRSVHCSFFH
jgi:hypothetical protein